MGGIGAAILVIYYLLNLGEKQAQVTKRVAPTGFEHSGGILVLRALALVFLVLLTSGWAERFVETPSFEAGAGIVLCAAPIPFAVAPRWIVWRFLQPLGWFRFSRIVLWLTSSPDADYQGMKNLLAVSLGEKTRYPMDADEPVDRWSYLIEALRTQAAEDFAKLDAMLSVIAELPQEAPVRKRLPRIGLEILALRSAERGQWDRIELLAAIRGSRLLHLLRALARHHRAEHDLTQSRTSLYALWLAAPYRLRMRRFVRAPEPQDVISDTPGSVKNGRDGAHQMKPDAPPFLIHLDLLRSFSELPLTTRAPENSSVRQSTRASRAIDNLIGRWEKQWYGNAQFQLHKRAASLGAPDPAQVADTIRNRIVGELVELALAGEARLEPHPNPSPFRAEIEAKLEDRVFEPLQQCLDRLYEGDEVIGLNASPMAEWRAWIEMTQHVDRLEAVLGVEGLETAWHNGLGLAAWNWPCRLGERHGIDMVWACYLQHRWVAELAERVGDAEAAKTNWQNMEIMANH